MSATSTYAHLLESNSIKAGIDDSENAVTDRPKTEMHPQKEPAFRW